MSTVIENELFEAAKRQVIARYPSGYGGAAAIATTSGRILTSVAPETQNDALSLCMEVGAYLEAHRLDEGVVYSLCVYRASEESDFIVLTPCGICQERLSFWGGGVRVAISNPENTLKFVEIRELMPHHWSQVNGVRL